jgi:serine/threonine protein phosphatase PrpC
LEERVIRVEGPPAGPPNSLRWISAASTHVGKARKINEDAALDYSPLGLWAVADGVGGAAAGDWASACVVEALRRLDTPASALGFLGAVNEALQSVNSDLRRRAEASGTMIATTVVALLFFQRHFACLWSGDSRLYLLRDSRLRQISRDHSEVQELVDAGVISPSQARYHPRGNVVTRAIGAQDILDAETVHEPLRESDVFLLCSDGLTKTMDGNEIAVALAQPIDRAVDALIQTTLDRGAPDNVTVVAVKVLPALSGPDDGAAGEPPQRKV